MISKGKDIKRNGSTQQQVLYLQVTGNIFPSTIRNGKKWYKRPNHNGEQLHRSTASFIKNREGIKRKTGHWICKINIVCFLLQLIIPMKYQQNQPRGRLFSKMMPDNSTNIRDSPASV